MLLASMINGMTTMTRSGMQMRGLFVIAFFSPAT
ncbi:hypothetical protein Desku_0997 [Desulfofundulus kuznetsovii DSM 6115]|jgi:hypothetical protein|uniref:Uncharacterized protein n=1 Tax=Desulfofundulus kuznetsovii (strain DSM 6115 / VKM B-1805 / 17) TaxID=760568 RepID=A0AAU8PM38_DESK7|nr:hypothetical protein Desku_0997 [Desulfofundulus kuznetsovii DSM 6115]